MRDNVYDINEVDPNVTVRRVRALVKGKGEEAGSVFGLSRTEITDMLFCAASLLSSVEDLLPPGFLELVMAEDFSGVSD